MPYRADSQNPEVYPSVPGTPANHTINMSGLVKIPRQDAQALLQDGATVVGDIDNPSPSMAALHPHIAITKALMGGTSTMRAAGEAYLPREPDETAAEYNVRLANTHLYNGYRRAVQVNVGRIFSKDVILDEDVNQEIIDMLDEDCDGYGRSFKVFLRDVCEEGIAHAMGWVLTDFPSTDNRVRTIQDERREGLRPDFRYLSADQVLGVDYVMLNGKAVMTKARIKHELWRTKAGTEFSYEKVHQVWVLEPSRFRIYEKVDGQADWTMSVDNRTTFNFIPLRPWIPIPEGPFEGLPPMLDLAHLNVRLWQSQSDQAAILHVGRMAILFCSGAEPPKYDPDNPNQVVNRDKQLVFSPRRVIYGPENSDMKYVEPTGAAIQAGRQDLEDIKAEMRLAGMELMLSPSNETATAKSIDAKSAFSLLQAIAKSFEDFVETILGDFAELAGKGREAGGSVIIDTDWGFDMADMQNYAYVMQLYQTGQITRKTLLQMARKYGILEEDFDVDAELELVQDELPNPTLPSPTGNQASEDEEDREDDSEDAERTRNTNRQSGPG